MGRFDSFEIVRTYTGKPYMSVTRNGVAFNKTAIEIMQKCKYVQPVIDKSAQEFAIIKCGEDADGAKEFFTGKHEVSYGVRWNSQDMRNTFESLMGWDLSDVGFQIDGEYFEDDQAMLFKLGEARPIAPRRKKG